MNRRRALLLCGLHRKRCAQLHGKARAFRYAAARGADAAGLQLFETGRAKPFSAAAKRTARQVRAYGAGTAKNDLRLRIGKRILSDTEQITAKGCGKAAAKAAKGLRCTVRAGQAFSPTLQSRVHPHLFAQKLLRAAVLTQKSGAYAAAQSSRMRPAAAERRASARYRGHAYAQKLLRAALLTQKSGAYAAAQSSRMRPAAAERRACAPYRGHAYAQKLLRPAALAQKTKRSAFARASQPAHAAVRHTAHGMQYGAPYAQKLLRPAALAQRTKARNTLRAHAAADAACGTAAHAFPFLLPKTQAGKRLPAAQGGKTAALAAVAGTDAVPARQKTTGQSSHAAKVLEKTPRPAGAKNASHSACSAAVYSEEKAPAAGLAGKGKTSGVLQPKTVRALAAALCSSAVSSAGGTAQQSGGTWEFPVLTDGTLTVTMVYEAAQQSETLTLA